MSQDPTSVVQRAESAWQLRYKNPAQTAEIGLQLLADYSPNGDSLGIAYGKLLVGVSNFLRSNEEGILANLIDALKIFEQLKNELGQVRCLIFLSNLSDNNGNLAKGLEYGLKGLKIVESTADREAESDLNGTLGQIYSRMADYENAIDFFQKSLAIREALGNIQATASSLNLIARAYSLKGDFDQSLNYYRKSLKIREDNNDKGALPWSYLGMASLYEKMGDDESATIHYQKGMDLNSDSHDLRCKLYCAWGMGKILTRKKNIKEALSNLKEALDICVSLKFKPIEFEIHFSLAEAYEADGNLNESLRHFKLFHTIKEEVLNAETSNKLKHQEISFAIEKSEQEAEIHRLKNVELKAAFEIIEEKNNHITNTIHYAQRIQNAMLPVQEEIGNHLQNFFILFLPKDIVSGDFYWFQNKNKSSFIAAVDCTGHGVPGALMSMIGNSLLNQIVLEKGINKPSEILNELHLNIKIALKQKGESSEFGGETRDGMDLALCRIDEAENDKIRIEYSGANRPLLQIRKGEMIELKADRHSIGGADQEKERTFTNHTLELNQGDSFYLYSDGVTDQFNEQDKKLGVVALRKFILEIQHLSMKDQYSEIAIFFKSWKGLVEQTDDVLLIGVRV